MKDWHQNLIFLNFSAMICHAIKNRCEDKKKEDAPLRMHPLF
jgi:hypothetical protein